MGPTPRLACCRWPKARPSPDLLARPAVCRHPTSMILTRARTLLRPCFARLLAALVGEPDGFAAGAFHARPLRWWSKSRRARKRALVRQSALRPRAFAMPVSPATIGSAWLRPRTFAPPPRFPTTIKWWARRKCRVSVSSLRRKSFLRFKKRRGQSGGDPEKR